MIMLTLWFIGLLCQCVNNNDITIAIIGTNDIHGSAFPTTLKRTYNNNTEYYQYGGLVYMARLINIIKEQYPGNSLFVDAGDQFQGGIQSSGRISSGKIINDFFGLLQLNASAIGNHQFDFGPSFLFPFMKAKDGPNLAANLRSQNNLKDFLPQQKSSTMYELASGIKIGIIGLSTIDTPQTTSGFSTHKFPQYKFLEYKNIVIDEANKLRRNGADAVLIASHVGNECNRNFTYKIWTKQDNQQGFCANDQMTQLITSLPEGTIQGVIQGHHHTVSHIFVNGIPIMGNVNGGYYFNVIYLTFRNREVIQAKIQGPIPVCQRVFEKTGRCNYISEGEADVGPLINWKFHNKDVYADPRLQAIYNQEWYPLMKPYEVILVETKVSLYTNFNAESGLGNLITDLLHERFPFSDFVLLNPGGFRTQWLPGLIQEQNFYNMFPFDNQVVSFKITGKELLETIKILQNGKAGFYDFYGIQTTARKFNGSKHQFVSARLRDGSEIQEEKEYVGVTTDFIILGGDDFKTVIQTTYIPRDIVELGQFKESIRQNLKNMKIINQQDVIDHENPRLVLIE